MSMLFIIGVLAIFFALNMGGASFGASFAAAYGGKVISPQRAAMLFVLFVLLGAGVSGNYVTTTLGEGIVPSIFITHRAIAIIFFSASLSMWVANLMKIPHSTSIVTVASIAGVGAYHGHLNLGTIGYLSIIWILLPIISFFLTYGISSYFYPPKDRNFWFYEKVANHRDRLKIFLVLASCYNAFAVGSNNVANVVGPLVASGKEYLILGFFVFGLIYGLGAYVFTGPLKTTSHKIVPLGLFSATVVCLVSGSLMLIASRLGIPQSFVMLKVAAVFAIGSVKHGPEMTFGDPIAKKTLVTWTINPMITFFISYGLSAMLLVRI